MSAEFVVAAVRPLVVQCFDLAIYVEVCPILQTKATFVSALPNPDSDLLAKAGP